MTKLGAQSILAVSLLGLAGGTTTVSIGSCAELQEAASSTSSDHVVGEVTTSEISCDSWTNLEINDNRLKLVADIDDDGVLVFHNVRFVIGSGGTLRVLPKVEFTGTEGETQEVDGGILNIAEGGQARFNSDVYMHDVEVVSVPPEGSDYTPDRWHGGCVYNKGTFRVAGAFEAVDCVARGGGGDSADGDGNGIWNGETGNVVLKGEVTMTDCGNREIEGNTGGAVYNQGNFVVFSDATFTENWSSAGAIYNGNTGVFKCLKNAMATFTGNRSSVSNGGAIQNSGGIMKFNGGADFSENYTEGDGGAIGNSGYLSISKTASFTGNHCFYNGGAVSNSEDAELILPSDTTFQDNYLQYPDWNVCPDIYQKVEGGYECAP